MNGGFIASHDYHSGDGAYEPSEQHAFSNAKALHAHLQQHIPAGAGMPAEGDDE